MALRWNVVVGGEPAAHGRGGRLAAIAVGFRHVLGYYAGWFGRLDGETRLHNNAPGPISSLKD